MVIEVTPIGQVYALPRLGTSFRKGLAAAIGCGIDHHRTALTQLKHDGPPGLVVQGRQHRAQHIDICSLAIDADNIPRLHIAQQILERLEIALGVLRAVVVQVQLAVMADSGNPHAVARGQNHPCRSRAMAGVMVGLKRDDLQGGVAAQVFMLRVQPTIAEVDTRPLARHLVGPGLAHIQALPPGAGFVEVVLA
ncbi:hypothetical protein D3C79_683190 [compost metagenome]